MHEVGQYDWVLATLCLKVKSDTAGQAFNKYVIIYLSANYLVIPIHLHSYLSCGILDTFVPLVRRRFQSHRKDAKKLPNTCTPINGYQ